jgi:hypothetical protein
MAFVKGHGIYLPLSTIAGYSPLLNGSTYIVFAAVFNSTYNSSQVLLHCNELHITLLPNSGNPNVYYPSVFMVTGGSQLMSDNNVQLQSGTRYVLAYTPDTDQRRHRVWVGPARLGYDFLNDIDTTSNSSNILLGNDGVSSNGLVGNIHEVIFTSLFDDVDDMGRTVAMLQAKWSAQ